MFIWLIFAFRCIDILGDRQHKKLIRESVSGSAPFICAPQLVNVVLFLLTNALASSTSAAYFPHASAYLRFCTGHNAVPFPASDIVLCGFLAFYFSLGKSYGILKTAFAAISNLSRVLGHSCEVFRMSARLRLLKRSFKKNSPSTKRKPRVPITVWVLLALLEKLDPSDHIYFSVLVVGVHGLFRAAELLYKPSGSLLRRRHITWLSNCVVIHLTHSKTDFFNEGVDVRLFKSGSKICPYTWLKFAWDSAAVKDSNAPVFQAPDGSAISYSFMLSWVKASLVSHLGFASSDVGLHSMRIGGATSLAILGYPDHVIKLFGRWKSMSYLAYIRFSESDLKPAMLRMSSVPSNPTCLFGGLSLGAAKSISISSIDINFPAHVA